MIESQTYSQSHGIENAQLRYVNIGIGRFRTLGGGGGGARFRILGGGGGKGGQIPSRHMTSCPIGFFINQCQIIAFLILKASTNFRIERNSFASTFKSN